jgi:hypothetical protein
MSQLLRRTEGFELGFIKLDSRLITIYEDIIHNTNESYDVDRFYAVIEDCLNILINIKRDIRIIIRDTLTDKYLQMFTKLLTICNSETTGALIEMGIPQRIIGIYNNKMNIPRIPYYADSLIPAIIDIVPDSSDNICEFVRMFSILYREYFYSDEPELEEFKIPLYLYYHINKMDKVIRTAISNWIKGNLKHINHPLDNNDFYLIDICYEFFLTTMLTQVDINWTNLYLEFQSTVCGDFAKYYFNASLDGLWLFDGMRDRIINDLAECTDALVKEFYYNPLLLRLIIGTKSRLFYTYKNKFGGYYECF